MTTKAAFITALGGATAAVGQSATFSTTHGAESLTIAAHGLSTGDGPFQLTSTGDLPAGIGPNKANNGLTFTPGTIADDVVEVNGVYYAFAADPTTGTPDGSVGTPYLVDVGGTDTISLANLVKAINATGTGGVTYAAEITTAHATVEAITSTATTLTLRARTTGTAGNAYTLSVSGNDGIAANAALFSGGLAALDYYAIRVDPDTIQLALTAPADELADIPAAVTFADDGTGTHSILTRADAVADAIEDVMETLTHTGSRCIPPETALPRAWSALIAALV